jgi:sulfate permease, SulP family
MQHSTTAVAAVSRFPNLAGDLRGGFASAIVSLPYAVTSAMIVFAPLGTAYIGHGLLAGALTALVAGLVTAVLGGTACQINGPRASVAVLMGSIVALASAHPALRGLAGADVSRILGVAMLSLMLAGALQIALGALRMGGAVRFLPYPVISGFMVGLGILVAGPQIPALLGVVGPDGWTRLLREPASHPGALLVGGTTIAVFMLVRRRRPKLPAPMIAMLLATLAHYAMALVPSFGVGMTGWDALGGKFPPMPWQIPEFVFDDATFWTVTDLLPAIVTLAFVGALETLLSSSVVSIVSNMRFNSRRELIAQGVSNIAVAAFGGVMSAGAPFRGVTNFNAGGRTRFSGAVNAVLVGALGLAAAPLLFLVPIAAWAGVLVVIGWDVASAWGRRLAGNPRADIGVGFAVAFVTLALGTVPAVLVGIAASVLLYVHRTSRAPIRGHYDGAGRSSLRVRTEAELAYLKDHGAQLRVVELQGALFFGTADRCGRELEALAGACREFIVDMRRVVEVDTTGALVLMQTLRRISEGGCRVALASVMPGGRRGRVLALAGVQRIIPESAWFADVDAALEAAENSLLAARRDTVDAEQELSMAQMDLCAGMQAHEVGELGQYFRRVQHGPGHVLFREGDPGEAMHLVAKGSVTARLTLRKKDRSRRLAAYGPGLIFGEMAVLEHKPRSANAVCDGETVLWSLERTELERMAAERPALYGRFLLALSRQMAWRVRATNLELRAALE